MLDNDDFIPKFINDETSRLFADDSEMFGEEDSEVEKNQVDDIDDSEIFAEDEEYDEENIEPYINTDSSAYLEPEDYEPYYYDEYAFFMELTYYNKICQADCNMDMLKRMVNFIVERFKERGVYTDVIINDKNKEYSKKHNRKTQDDIKRIKELIDKGLNNSQIERITGITRKTISKYRRKF